MKDWRTDAACRDYIIVPGDDIWYSDNTQDRADAVAICRMCPVASTCLEVAIDYERTYPGGRHGVWGGLTPDERAYFSKFRRTPPRCGTESGYQRHMHSDGDACEPCRQAHREHSRRRRVGA